MNLPRYKCHKEVQAVKILDLIPSTHAPCEFMYNGTAQCGYQPNECMHTNSTLPTIPDLGRHEYISQGMNDPRVAFFIKHDVAGLEDIPLTWEFMERHKPQRGGYFVVYDNGYESYSPAKPFEDGYTRIPE